MPDAVIELLLRFLAVFFTVIGKLSPQLSKISNSFPSTLYKMQQLVCPPTSFTRYIACDKCYRIYERSECIKKVGTQEISKLCMHKNLNHERPCQRQLLRQVKLLHGKQILYPIKVYCYAHLKKYMESLLARPEFCSMCDHWKNSRMSRDKDIYLDIYDGNIWKEFQMYNGQPFLSEPNVYGLMLNIDWFRPCKHTEYSIGAIYLTVMNLPRDSRFRQENVMSVGLIPGPREPKHDINSQLQPLVQELLQFLNGIHIKVHNVCEPVVVRCALLCVACDIPASRKVCGFLGHSAERGCSKCLKQFSGHIGQKDYSGFDRSQWKLRTLDEHRKNVAEILKCRTVRAQCELESKYGCRYSVLLDLPYFDPVRMTVIDPMHNLFLGSAKHMLKNVWMKNNLNAADLSVIQGCVDSMRVSTYIGRILHKIFSSISGFTADQYKSWTNFFSIPCLTLSPPVPTIVGMDSAYLQKIISRLLFEVSST